MTTTRTDTAHKAWDDRWKTEAGRNDWIVPEGAVIDCAKDVLSRRLTRALDLGCGVGRHALALAEMGFEVTAADASESGLTVVAREAHARKLSVKTTHTAMTALPFADAAFDYVLAFNVIYHGDEAVVRQALAEIARVLATRGTFQATMMSKRNAHFGRGVEIAANTFVQDGDDVDKHHPHFFCNAAELVALLGDFEVLSLADRLHGAPDSWHWHVIAERSG